MPLIQGNAKSAAGGFYDTEINQSLRFNDDDSAYLSWTPASAGNRKTWTWSGWVKRGNISSVQYMLDCHTASTTNTSLYFTSNDKLSFFSRTAGTANGYKLSTAVFRDVSAWYHVVCTIDTTDATAADRIKLWVNGERLTAFDSSIDFGSSDNTHINTASTHEIGRNTNTGGTPVEYLDGYLAEVNFIDGTALDASYFGETKSGVWIPKAYEGSYGTNGFYLPFNNDYSVEGFSAVTWRGNGTSQYIGGVGFEPDLVWIKQRSNTNHHALVDSVRGVLKGLSSSSTASENTFNHLTAFNTDGFSVGTSAQANSSGGQYVAWCWDAGTGSPVSNTDGSITSTVKASTDYGFSIVSYTTTTTATDTVGHGLDSAPEIIFTKDRNNAIDWFVFTTAVDGSIDYLKLNKTDAKGDQGGSPAITDTTFTTNYGVARNTIAYCFHSVSGYSKIGSYTGNGSSSGPTVTTGFRPAFVMVKSADRAGSWRIYDSTRDTSNPPTKGLFPDLSNAESTSESGPEFLDTGFQISTSSNNQNASGENYIYMAFADKREAAFWLDQSGNNNDFENNNLTESDISLDSPTNNFATWNALTPGSTLSEGNLQVSTNVANTRYSTIGMSSGKWYWEVRVSGENGWFALTNFTDERALSSTSIANIYDGTVQGTYQSYSTKSYTAGDGWSAGDVLGFALDADAKELKVYHNNTLKYTFDTFTVDGEYFFGADRNNSTPTITHVINFGQDSSFAGNETAQGNTDDNGYGDFYYAPPSGYLALCTANLPDPVAAINPAQDGSPQDHFNPVLYTGNGTSQDITGVGFTPDLVWHKGRSVAYDHSMVDSIRGDSNVIFPSKTNAEQNPGDQLDIITDGFTTTYRSANNANNQSSQTYVAWNWKANGSGVSNTDGSITSTVSANTDAGFSIVDFTTTAAVGTIGHGLTQEPDVVIVKNRQVADGWYVYHSALGATKGTYLHLTNAASTVNWWNSTEPTSSVFTLNFGNTYDHIAYCFHSVEGFSKFGSYTGNGSADGPFVYTGFRPAFVMIKNTQNGTNSWVIADSKRNTFNEVDLWLQPNGNYAESNLGTTYDIDFLSSGFKIRDAANFLNQSTYKLIYMAFAENPFKYANAR